MKPMGAAKARLTIMAVINVELSAFADCSVLMTTVCVECVYSKLSSHVSPTESTAYVSWRPSRKTFKAVGSGMRLLETENFTNPLVPDDPLTVKEISPKVELNANEESVELDSTRNTSFPVICRMLMFLAALASRYSGPIYDALRVNNPVAVGIQLAE